MPAYFVAIRESVQDPQEMEVYGQKAGRSGAGHNLKPLAMYGQLRATDGEPVEGAVILEFPTFAEAEAWYDSPAYQDALAHRLRGATYRTFIIQGVD
jgi:uncharacterized protein (DUF1330 family)